MRELLPVRRGVVGVVAHDNRFLVIRRSQHVLAPGKLCFPGGGIEPGETPQAALVREFQEELGLEILPTVCDWENLTPWNVHLQWWFAEMAAGQIPRPDPKEVESFYWLELEEMIAHPEMLESNLPYLERLRTKSRA